MEIKKDFDLEGHRGCRGLMPENTIPAFIKALDIGVSTLEMDVVITADEKVLISHEPFFNHEISTKPTGETVKEGEEHELNIYKMTYEETQSYDVGLKPNPRFPEQQKLAVHKPSLSSVIDSVIKYCKEHHRSIPNFNIETKSKPSTDNIYHPETGKFVELLMKVITGYHIENNVIIQSFDFRTLQYLNLHYPAIKKAALIEVFDHLPFDEQINKLGFLPVIYSPAWELVTEELVQQCHQKNILLVPWTVNDITTMQKLVKLGVDGLITDYPDRFKAMQ